MVSCLLFVVSVRFAALAAAGEPIRETIPFFGHLQNAKEDSALSMDCDGDPFGTIDCTFTQVTVSVRGTDDVEQARQEMVQDLAKPGRRKEARQALCPTMKPAMPEQPPQRRALTERSLGMLAKPCGCEDDQCFDREVIQTLLTLERKCSVWTHTFKARLNRVAGQRKWVGMSEPSGLCQAVNATVIEGDAKGLSWRFTQTRLTADKASELCKGLVINEPTIYASEYDGGALLNCEVIDFGH